MPPRHGKSRTAVLLSQWLFGRDPSEQIMTGSYNETLSTTFARAVRDGIAEERFDPSRIVFSDIFPQTRIKYGEAAAGKSGARGTVRELPCYLSGRHGDRLRRTQADSR